MKDPMDDFRTNYFQAIRDMVNYSFLHFFSVKNCKILDIGVDGDLSTSKEFIKKEEHKSGGEAYGC